MTTTTGRVPLLDPDSNKFPDRFAPPSVAADAAAAEVARAGSVAAASDAEVARDESVAAAERAEAVPAQVDTAMADQVGTGGEFDTKLNATIGAEVDGTFVVRQALTAPTLQRVTKTAILTGEPRLIDQFDGFMWGINVSTGDIHKSTDGTAWTLVNTTWPGASNFITRMLPTADGEVMAMTGTELRKSSGWATNPATATWSANKVTPNGTCLFNGFGFDGDGQKFIIVEYNSSPANWDLSRYGHISTDAGDTWTTVYDSEALHGAPASDESHLHLACYDPWADVFYIGEGHGSAGGVYYTSDDGATWGGPLNVESDSVTLANNAPTVMIATDDGLVMGSDNAENGLFGMLRKDNPADQAIVRTWQIVTGRPGLIAFAQRAIRDPRTGMVFVSFRSEYGDTPLTLAAGTASSGGLVYEEPTLPVSGGTDLFGPMAFVDENTLVMYGLLAATPYLWRGTFTKPGAGAAILDKSGDRPGITSDGSGLARGAGSSAGLQGTALGHGAKAPGQGSAALGHSAFAGGTDSVAFGDGYTNHQAGVALPGETTTQLFQVKWGQRFHDLSERAAVAPPAANTMFLYAMDDGNGRTVLVAQFATGAARVIASQLGSRTVTGSVTLGTYEEVVIINAGADPTITLPNAVAANGRQLTVKNVGTAPGGATITPATGTIDGAVNLVLARWEKVTLLSDGANWLTI